MTRTPDAARDIIVKHVTQIDEAGLASEQWQVFLGSERRAMADSADRAFVFARLLADLMKRPVWLHHDSGGLQPIDPSSIRGCSCC